MMTVILIMWRPKGINEAIPATVGALIVWMAGGVSNGDLSTIGNTISGAAITIIATIVIAMVLESAGFFQWAAAGLEARARGSGYRLFLYVNLVCFLMTLFFNNDGSILITTPILIILLNRLRLKNHQKVPYLLSGALIATASSAPIGVSNIVNLIALKIVGMSLYMHTLMMFVPATAGLLLMFGLLFLCLRKELPRRLPGAEGGGRPLPPHLRARPEEGGIPRGIRMPHPLKSEPPPPNSEKRNRLMRNLFLFVFAERIALFAASYVGIPIEWVAVAGSLILLAWRWQYLKIPPSDIVRKTPWHILVFAFAMYVIVYGLHNMGLTDELVRAFRPLVSGNLLNTSLLMGGLLTALSTLFNNHPALMVGTLTLTQMGLDPLSLKIAYLANVIGSDIGSLLLPIGTLASLLWFHLLRANHIRVEWRDYVKVTVLVIPATLLFTLVALYYWVSWIAPYTGL